MKTKRKSQYVVSVLLIAAMIFGLVPEYAMAAVTTDTVKVREVTEEEMDEEVTGAVSESGVLEDLLLYTGAVASNMQKTSFLGKANQDYPDRAVFDPEQTEYTLEIADTVLNTSTAVRFAMTAAQEGTTAKVVYDGDKEKTVKIVDTTTHTGTNWVNVITKSGKNEFSLVVTPPEETSPLNGQTAEPVTYHFTIYCLPTLSGLSVTADGATVYLDQTFAPRTSSYNGKVLETAQKALITATPKQSDYTVSINGVSDNEVDLSQTRTAQITVGVGEGSDYRSDWYEVNFENVAGYSMQMETTPSNAGRVLYNSAGVRVYPAENGSFEDLMEGMAYNYVVTAHGYVAQSGTVSSASALADGKLTVVLEQAAASEPPLTEYTGEWTNFRGNDQNMGITDKKTATLSENANLKWAVKYGSGWSAAPTPPIILNGYLYLASGKKVMKLDKETGEKLAESEDMAANVGFATNPITYGEGLLFVQIGKGRIQALRADTLESVWISEEVGGQTISPITYKNGYVYLGTWNSELKDATFFGLSVTDEDPSQTTETKLCSWKVTHTGGFYWAGAYATDDYVIFGSDDGTKESDYVERAVLYSVSPKSGNIIDTIDGIKGDIRSTVSYDEGTDRIYFSTKGGIFYSVKVNADGTFDQESLKCLEIGGMSTCTPLVYKGRAYLGVSGSAQFGPSGHCVKVIDVETMEEIYSVPTPGYVQTSALLSTAYEEETGKVYIYVPYNYTPGGIYVIEDSAGQTEAKGYDLFVPTGDLSQYCICSLVCDAEGTMYYKNDSGYVMAIENTKVDIESISLNRASVSLKPERTIQLTAQYFPTNATVKGVTWTTSNPEVATVTEDGLVSSVAEGTALITATTKNLGKTAVCEITVVDKAAKTIKLLEKKKEIKIGDTYALQVKTTPVGNGDVLTYSSNNEEVATVDADGIVTGVSEGIAKITAATEKNKKVVCTIKVDRTIPVVTGVSANNIKKNAVTLSWNQVEDAEGYYVYLYTPATEKKAEKYKKIKTLKETKKAAAPTSCVIKGLKAANQYQYKVVAFDKRADKTIAAGDYSESKFVLTLPNASGIKKAKKTADGFVLSWKKVKGAAGYTVYTSTEKNGDYTEIGTFEGETNLTTTIEVPEAGYHYYKVKTYIMDGNEKLYSDYSSAKKVRIK